MGNFPSIQKGNKLPIFSTLDLTIIIKHLRGENVYIFNITHTLYLTTWCFTTHADSVTFSELLSVP